MRAHVVAIACRDPQDGSVPIGVDAIGQLTASRCGSADNAACRRSLLTGGPRFTCRSPCCIFATVHNRAALRPDGVFRGTPMSDKRARPENRRGPRLRGDRGSILPLTPQIAPEPPFCPRLGRTLSLNGKAPEPAPVRRSWGSGAPTSEIKLSHRTSLTSRSASALPSKAAVVRTSVDVAKVPLNEPPYAGARCARRPEPVASME